MAPPFCWTHSISSSRSNLFHSPTSYVLIKNFLCILSIYPHICYISISPRPNFPHLSECDSNPRKIPAIFANLSSVLKDMAGTMRTKRRIEVCRRIGSHYIVKTKRRRMPRWRREIQHKQSCNVKVLVYRSEF